MNNDKYGFINAAGKVVIPLKYSYANGFSEGYASVNMGGEAAFSGFPKGGKWGFINNNDKTVLSLKYDFANSFWKGLAEVETNGRKFKINKNGDEVK
ncbi:KWG Leptospira [compost metagenome]